MFRLDIIVNKLLNVFEDHGIAIRNHNFFKLSELSLQYEDNTLKSTQNSLHQIIRYSWSIENRDLMTLVNVEHFVEENVQKENWRVYYGGTEKRQL